MTVDIDKLIRMGEQVADNMRYTDDEEMVVAKVADHLTRFWDPRMKDAIKAHCGDEAVSMSPTLRAAVERLS